MQEREFKDLGEDSASDSALDAAAAALGRAEAFTETLPVERTVTLVYQSCCGCGCRDVELRRTVPGDSPLKDGDRVSELKMDDEVLS